MRHHRVVGTGRPSVVGARRPGVVGTGGPSVVRTRRPGVVVARGPSFVASGVGRHRLSRVGRGKSSDGGVGAGGGGGGFEDLGNAKVGIVSRRELSGSHGDFCGVPSVDGDVDSTIRTHRAVEDIHGDLELHSETVEEVIENESLGISGLRFKPSPPGTRGVSTRRRGRRPGAVSTAVAGRPAAGARWPGFIRTHGPVGRISPIASAVGIHRRVGHEGGHVGVHRGVSSHCSIGSHSGVGSIGGVSVDTIRKVVFIITTFHQHGEGEGDEQERGGEEEGFHCFKNIVKRMKGKGGKGFCVFDENTKIKGGLFFRQMKNDSNAKALEFELCDFHKRKE